MRRSWIDELDRPWDVELEVPQTSPDLATEGGDTTLVFAGEGAEARAVDVLGPMEEVFDDLDDQALQHALEAASTGVGILLVEADGTLWWVRGPDAEVAPGGWAVKFTDGQRDFTHDGPLEEEPEFLSEDELLELLDDARGRIMDPLDLRV